MKNLFILLAAGAIAYVLYTGWNPLEDSASVPEEETDATVHGSSPLRDTLQAQDSLNEMRGGQAPGQGVGSAARNAAQGLHERSTDGADD